MDDLEKLRDETGISLISLSATSPLNYNSSTGVFTIQQANTSNSGYLSSTDWNTFNNGVFNVADEHTFTAQQTFNKTLTIDNIDSVSAVSNPLTTSYYSAGDYLQFWVYPFFETTQGRFYNSTGLVCDVTISNNNESALITWSYSGSLTPSGFRIFRALNDVDNFTSYYDVGNYTTLDDDGGVILNWTSSGSGLPSPSPTHMFTETIICYSDNDDLYAIKSNGLIKTDYLEATKSLFSYDGNAVRIYGDGDGGYATRGHIEGYGFNTNYKLWAFSDDGSQSYGGLYMYGDVNLAGGRLFEFFGVDRSVGGDGRRVGMFGQSDGAGNWDTGLYSYGHQCLLHSSNGFFDAEGFAVSGNNGQTATFDYFDVVTFANRQLIFTNGILTSYT